MNDISELIGKFLSDPAAAKAAAELAGKLMQNGDGGSQGETEPKAASTATAETAPQDMLSAVLKDPEFMKKMPELLSTVAPMLNGALNGKAVTVTQAPASLPIPTRERSEQAKRSALLLALKPYLSPERAETVDHIIRLTELIELVSLIK
ncbi:MAG: hypothetical protein IJN63_00735 [Clostridia bacterium]|nr:hypothetical protein [Clostridia bacterium]